MPSWKKVILSGSDVSLNSLYVNGPITGSDIKINDWGSVSASLASIQNDVPTLDQVTTAGSSSTNDIFVSSSKSYYLGANSYLRREQNGGGNENIQLNGSIRLNPNTSANANNGVLIGGNGYLLAPNSSRNAQLNYGGVSGQFGVYRLNVYGADSTFQHDLTVVGNITGSDIKIDDWGSVSASLASIEADVSTQNLQDVTDNGNSTTNSINVNGIIVTGSIVNYNTFTSTTFTSGSSIADATTNEVIFTIDATVYESLAMEYVIFDSGKTNKRAGTFRSTWDDNTSAVVFDETTTTDIGNTSGFTLDASNNGSGTISVRATNNVGSAMTIIYERKLLG